MSSQRTRFDRRTAELLMSGGTATNPQTRRLAALLDAAAGGLGSGGAGRTGSTVAGAAGTTAAGGGVPAAPGAVAGEMAALAAYRAAHRHATPHPRRESVIGKYLTLKVALGVATALTAGGVAVAAGSGALPDTAADQAGAHREAVGGATASHGKAGSPSPSLTGLCTAYGNVSTKSKGKALDSPAFSALVTAAGGKDKVPGYCDELLAGKDKGNDDAPAGGASAHPTGAPGDKPGGPGDHPTGPPTERPTH
ncbi:MAG: hypothetical protein ACRDT4_21730 [Micromonosporaceae bacterium]